MSARRGFLSVFVCMGGITCIQASIHASIHAYILLRSSLFGITVEPLLRGHPDERPPPLERPLFWCKRGGLTRGVPLYLFWIIPVFDFGL